MSSSTRPHQLLCRPVRLLCRLHQLLCRPVRPLCRSVRRIAALYFAVALSIAAGAQRMLHVPADYPTIQSAIDAAQTGDTIVVDPGTYYENLTIDQKAITLGSSGDVGATILDGQHLGTVLRILNTTAAPTLVSGFTIRNGSPTDATAQTAGIFVSNSWFELSHSILEKNAGINIGVFNSTAEIDADQISTASGDGGSCALPSGNAPANPSTGVFFSGATLALAPSGSPLPSSITSSTIFGDGSRCSGIAITARNFPSGLNIQSNTLRNNLLALAITDSPVQILQNLIFRNAAGGLTIATTPSNRPSTDPATTTLINNTIVNNLTAPDPLNSSAAAEITLTGTVAQIGFRNNILLGATPRPILTCETQTPSLNDTPLLLDHNDLYNTSAGPILAGDCTTAIGDPIGQNGNIFADPQLSGSADLHPLAGSPVLDAGINSLTQLPTDFDGTPRLADSTGKGFPTIDLGAYERAAPASPATPVLLTLTPAAFVTPPGTLSLAVAARAIFTGSAPSAPVTTGAVTLYSNGIATATLNLAADGTAAFSLPTPTLGILALTAGYAPSPGLSPSTSPLVYVLVTDPTALSTTTLTLAATPATQTLNQPVLLTLHLGSILTSSGATGNGNPTPGPVPPGAVSLFEGSTLLSILQPDSTGLATYTIAEPGLGPHTWTATYAGTTLYSAATATTAAIVNPPAPTTLAATITPSPAAFGQTITLAATVSAALGNPTGFVTFTDGATSLGTLPLIAGSASLSTSALSRGAHTITFTYKPDPAFSAGTATRAVVVGGTETATTLTSSRNPASAGDSLTFTITVSSAPGSSASPAGAVTLTDSGIVLASAPLAPASASVSTAAVTLTLSKPGAHQLTATYTPATPADLSSAGTLTQTTTAAPAPGLTLTTTPNPARITDPITLSVATHALPAATTLAFLDGNTVLATSPVPDSILLGNVAFSLAPGRLTLGLHTLSVQLQDARGVTLAASNILQEQVTSVPTTLVLTATPNPALATAPITFSAVLATQSPAGAAPSGTVTFSDGQTILGDSALDTSGHATLTLTTLSAATHILTATYSGNTLLAASTSNPITETIQRNPTSTTLAIASAGTTAFTPVTLTAHVASRTSATPLNTASCTPACAPITVTFFAGTATLGSVPIDATGSATLTFHPGAGSYAITALFSGSTLFSSSTSTSAGLAVIPREIALRLTASPNAVSQHGTVTLAATPLPTTPVDFLFAAAPTGAITFLEGATTLGTVTLSGSAHLPYIPDTPGTHQLIALYSGDANFLPASATLTLSVIPRDFTLTLADPSLTLKTEHHAPTSVAITTSGALSDTVHLSCSGLPAFASCTFNSADLSLNPTQTGTNSTTAATSLMLSTDAILNYASLTTPRHANSGNSPFGIALLALLLPTALLPALRGKGIKKPRIPNLLLALLLTAATLTLAGCSGLYPGHTPPGTYIVTVIAHGNTTGIEHSAQLTLVVTE